jgi:endonuclease YncB( thermonuclease family)
MIRRISKYFFPVIIGHTKREDGVYDADTIYGTVDNGFSIKFEDQTFRLYGINAYEIRRNSRKGIGDEHVKLGKIAAAVVEDFIPDGTEVIIETIKSGDKGKYGRYLALVYVPIAGNEAKIGLLDGLDLLAVDSEDPTHFCLNNWLVREEHAWEQEY